MRIDFITIVLDGMPFITHHLPIFNSLPKSIEWNWNIVEGAADNVADTKWCKPISPRLSNDGTHEYLLSIIKHPRVRIWFRDCWGGKISMVNIPLKSEIHNTDLIWQIDSDELWTSKQIQDVALLFENNLSRNCADFVCNYFVGYNIIVDHIPGTWTNNHKQEWRRVWRWFPGFKFTSHEPPITNHKERVPFTQSETLHRGLVFNHYPYVNEKQIRFKEEYYGYKDAVKQWKRLQENKVWPVKLRDYFGWINDDTTARTLY